MLSKMLQISTLPVLLISLAWNATFTTTFRVRMQVVFRRYPGACDDSFNLMRPMVGHSTMTQISGNRTVGS
jgi:hypothetical protein